MTNNTRRLARYQTTLATLSAEDIALLRVYIKGGYGACSIKFETHYTLKQINAAFALING